MSRGYKYKESSVKRLSVHIDEDEDYNEQIEELEQVIQVIDQRQGRRGNINQVIARLVQEYRNLRSHFDVWQITNRSYLIKLPLALDKNEVVGAMTLWGMRNNWWFLHYDQENENHNHSMKFRAQIRILNFPLHCWTRDKVIRAVSPIGYVEYINTENIEGPDRRFINLGITCDDPRNIPKYLDVFYGKNKWRSCKIIVLDWSFDTWVPDSVRDGEDGRHFPGWSSEDDDEKDQQDINTRRKMVNRHERLQRYYNSRSPPSSGSTQPSDTSHNAHLSAISSTQTMSCIRKKEEQYFGPCRPGVQRINKMNLPEKIGDSDINNIKKKIFNWTKVSQYLGCHSQQDEEMKQKQTVLDSSSELRLEKESNITGKSATALSLKSNLLSGFTKACIMTPIVNSHVGKRGPSNQVHCFNPNKDIQQPHFTYKPKTLAITQNTKENLLRPLYKNKRISLQMAQDPNVEEDELINRLLHQATIGAQHEQVIRIPNQVVQARNWGRCILVKVITEGRVTEDTFSMYMRPVWKVHPNTVIEGRREKEFLVEFMNEKDLFKVLDGWWHFRGDLIAMKRVYSQKEADEAEVDTIDLWVQAYGFPMGLILPKAVPDIMRAVGTPISDPQIIYDIGLKAYKIKLMVSLKKPVLHTLYLKNELIGQYKVYLVYDKVKKICLFCGLIGHVKEQCVERRMFLRIRESQQYKDRKELWDISDENFKPLIIDHTKVPLVGSSTQHALDSMGKGTDEFVYIDDGGKGKKVGNED